jgi:hypothetical protein
MNISWKEKLYDELERQFQATVNREVTNLNCRASTGSLNPREKIPDSWFEALVRSRINIQDIACGKNRLVKDDDFQQAIFKSRVDFRREIDGLWRGCIGNIKLS